VYPAVGGQSAAADDASTRLVKLEALRQRAILTDAEFEPQRTRLEGS
jgi:hypothetical protein